MDVSIIIPFFNSGKYLREALESVKPFKNHPDIKCELVIINDGSTDTASINVLNELEKEGYTIIHQSNTGPASARNAGVRATSGEFILFLDADNKIRDIFIYKGIDILRNTDADIVHGKPHFFGESSEVLFKPGVFHMPSLLARNYIDVCSIFKRKVWETLGGLDEERILIGHDDWEFWIRAGAAGFKFHYLDQVIYDYRIHGESLSSAVNLEKYDRAKLYVYNKHPKLVIDAFFWLSAQLYAYEQDKKRPVRSLFKFLYLKYLKRRD